jgi:DNA-binding CsgD family transcriptional regulator
LVQNIHKTVKDALSLEMAHDLFVREGDGWIRMVDSPYEETDLDTENNDDFKGLAVIKPETIGADDLARRILLAGLTPKQAEKYKKTLSVLEWTESGLRTTDIAKKLSMKKKDVQAYRLKAPEIIETVEQKIDAYYHSLQDAVLHTSDGQTAHRQKTIANKARPSSESIVEPYKEVVLGMVKEGKTHRDIHPVFIKAGFKGSKNAIYQYIIKYAYENGIPNGRASDKRPVSERITQAAEPRPLRISVERVSRTTLYENILHTAAVRRDEIKQSLLGLEKATNNTSNGIMKSNSDEWTNKTQYADCVAKLVFDTLPKKKNSKKN